MDKDIQCKKDRYYNVLAVFSVPLCLKSGEMCKKKNLHVCFIALLLTRSLEPRGLMFKQLLWELANDILIHDKTCMIPILIMKLNLLGNQVIQSNNLCVPIKECVFIRFYMVGFKFWQLQISTFENSLFLRHGNSRILSFLTYWQLNLLQ